MATIDKKAIREIEKQSATGTKDSSEKVTTIDISLDDSELNAHIAEFVSAVQKTVVACKENLLTQENAQAAANAIADLRRTVHQHRRTAHALRRLLQNEELKLPEIITPEPDLLH